MEDDLEEIEDLRPAEPPPNYRSVVAWTFIVMGAFLLLWLLFHPK